jgi:hypothetical protein
VCLERGQRRLGPEDLGQAGFDVPVRQAPHPARDDQSLQGVGEGDAPAEQGRGETLLGAPQLGALQLHGAHVGAHRRRGLPAVAGTGRAVLVAALVAAPGQQGGHLRLHRGLHDQADAETGDLLEHRGEGAVAPEQLIDLGPDALDGDTRFGTGVGLLPGLRGFGRNLRPSLIYTRDQTPPHTIRSGR